MEFRVQVVDTSYKDVYNSTTDKRLMYSDCKVIVWNGEWKESIWFSNLSSANDFADILCRHYHLGHFNKMSQLRFFEFCSELSSVVKKDRRLSTIDVARMIEEIGGVEL